MKSPKGVSVPFDTVWDELHKVHEKIPDSLSYASGHVLSLEEHVWYEEVVTPDELSRRIVDPNPSYGGHIHPSPDGFRLALPGETISEIAKRFEERSNEHTGNQMCPDRIRQLARDWDNDIDLGPLFFEVRGDIEEPVIIDGLHRSVAVLLSGRPGTLRAFYAYPRS